MNKFNILIASLKKRLKRWSRKFSPSKRQQFVGVTFILTIVLILTQIMSVEWRYPMVLVLSLLTYVLSAWSLREDLNGIEWVTLLVLPTAFTAAVALFYFLLPIRWLTRLPIALLYAVGMYALLLTENIYNVAVDRSIALLRAAHSVGFLLTLVTYFLLLSTILALRLPLFVGSIVVGLLSFILILQTLWTIELEAGFDRRLWHITVILSVFLAELSWIFTFWPVKPVLITLFLTTCFYSTVGMSQQYLAEKLYRKTTIEFVSVAVLVLGIVLLTTRWRGNF